jgi:hypothetical protein
MASGNRCIVLEQGVEYDTFPEIAGKWAKELSLRLGRKADGPDERVWECERDGCRYWFGWDHWFPELCLEPQDDEAGEAIVEIGYELGIDGRAEHAPATDAASAGAPAAPPSTQRN